MYDYLSYHATNENILYFFKKGDYIKGHIMSELLRAPQNHKAGPGQGIS
jgi:hypothetical protein